MFFSDILLNICIAKYLKYLILLKRNCIIADNKKVKTGMTVSDIAKKLEISIHAARKRLEVAKEKYGIEPITREALYDPSVISILEKVEMGRPKKEKLKAEKKDKK